MANGAELNFFSIRLRELREAAGYTLQGFAEAIGVSRQTVYLWESGAGFPEVGKLQAISGVLGVSIAALFAAPGTVATFSGWTSLPVYSPGEITKLAKGGVLPDMENREEIMVSPEMVGPCSPKPPIAIKGLPGGSGVLVLNPNIEPTSGSLVGAILDDSLFVARIIQRNDGFELKTEGGSLIPFLGEEAARVKILGVVTGKWSPIEKGF